MAAFADDSTATENLGVMEQPRPDYDAKGIVLGDDWILYPALVERSAYDNNVVRSQLIGAAPSDWFLETTPVVSLQRKTDTVTLGLTGNLDNLSYTRFHRLDVTDWTIGADGSLNLARQDFSAAVSASYGEYHEGFESAEVTRAVQQSTYTRYFRGHYDASVGYNPGNWRLGAGGSYDSLDWQPTMLLHRNGNITSISNRDRDVTFADPYLRAGYQATPELQPFVRAIYDSRAFLMPASGNADRSSAGYRLDGGVTLKLGKALKGEVYAGYLHQDFADRATRDFSTLDYGAAIDWYVAPTLTVHVNALRGLSDVILPGVLVTDDQSVRFGFDSELRHDLLLQGSVAYTHSKYAGLARTDDYPSAGVTLRYLINRYASADVSYSYSSRASTISSTDFRDEIVSLGLLLHI